MSSGSKDDLKVTRWLGGLGCGTMAALGKQKKDVDIGVMLAHRLETSQVDWEKTGRVCPGVSHCTRNAIKCQRPWADLQMLIL